MRKYILGLFVFIAPYSILSAQDSLRGVYLSVTDFRNKTLSYKPIEGQKYEAQLNEIFYKPFIKIIIGDSTYFLNKDSIFGYRDKTSTVYRFYNKNIYKMLNSNETILLYSHNNLGGYKNSEIVVSYYFSINFTLFPLSKNNLKRAFPDYPAFHELLDMYFDNDTDLIRYDTYYKMYKLNRVFQFSNLLILNTK